jgi:RimJ/RimL family protein N-acetyltransferase
LRIRRASAEDLDFLVELAAEDTVAPYLFPGAGDRDALRSVIETAEEPEGLLIVESADGAPLGALELSIVNRRSRIGQLRRMMVAPVSRRSGVGLRATELACRLAFEEHGLHRLQAECYGDNVPGQRLLERAGFTREGVRRRAYWRREQWQDGVMFGLLADELP